MYIYIYLFTIYIYIYLYYSICIQKEGAQGASLLNPILLPGSWVKAEFAGLAGKCVKPQHKIRDLMVNPVVFSCVLYGFPSFGGCLEGRYTAISDPMGQIEGQRLFCSQGLSCQKERHWMWRKMQ